MKISNIYVIAAVALVAYTACKDTVDPPDNNNNNSGKTKSEYLTQKKWKVSSLVTSNTDIWNTPFIDACNRDNIYNFRTDDSLSVHDMTSKCNGTDPDSTVSFYKLYNNNTQLILNVKLTSTVTVKDTAEIVTLDENTLKINADYSSVPATLTFIHP
ncbi:MAG TPA: hypothetical protein VGF79_02415 [Bacteroidia bacterium]